MTERVSRDVPEMLAIVPGNKGYELRDASKVAPGYALVPTSNPLWVARELHEVVTVLKKELNMYTFYAPKVDKDGKIVLARDPKGNILVDDKGNTLKETLDLARAIREVEDGTRVAVIAKGYFGTYKVNMYPAKEKAATKKVAAEYDEVAQYFRQKYEAAKKKK